MAQKSQRGDQPQPVRSPLRTWLVYVLIAFAVLFAAFNLDQVEVKRHDESAGPASSKKSLLGLRYGS